MTNANNEAVNVDFTEMSDEDFLKFDINTITNNGNTSQNKEDNDTININEESEEETDKEEDILEDDLEEDNQETVEDNGSEDDKEESNEEEDTDLDLDINLIKETYKKITSPFKANGKEISISDPDEIITLMQKGANYTQKMQTMAPHFRIIQTLDKNGLLTEDKINFLIDLSKNNPEAIKKLIKDSELDTWKLTEDTEEGTEYRANDHIISETEYDLREVVDRVTQSDSGKLAMREVTDVWDQDSQDEAIENPQILEVITSHIEDGTYDKIKEEMYRLSIVNKLDKKKTFLQNYLEVGNSLSGIGNNTDNNQDNSNSDNSNNGIGSRTKIGSRSGKPKTKNTIKNDSSKHASIKNNSTNSDGASNLFDLSDEEFLAKSAEYERKFLKGK